MNVVHYVRTVGATTIRQVVTCADHASAIEAAAGLRATSGVSCVWIGSKRHGGMLDAIALRQAERTEEPTI